MKPKGNVCPICMGRCSYPVARLLQPDGTIVENARMVCGTCAGSGIWPPLAGQTGRAERVEEKR